jgi:hypothetical protein
MPPLNRRQLIRTGLAGSVTAALAAWAGPGAAAPLWAADGLEARQRRASPSSARTAAPCIPLHAVVLDERLAEAARFGASARSKRLSTRVVRGDVTDLWYGELYPLWKERAAPVAGLTAYAALFCLEQLAWDHRMRVIYRGAHARRADGRVEHILAGPQEIVQALAPTAQCDWPAELASSIAAVESSRGWTGLAPASGASERRCFTEDGVHSAATLYSWVIALPARA